MAMASSCGETSDLHLRHRIFISHSGSNKTFARFLYKELKNHWFDAFFDEESLPKAKEVNMHNILIEAKCCKLALLVLTPDFFTKTRNPMLEVMAFVESNVPLLPLFYQLTVEEVKQSRELFKAKWIELSAKAIGDCPQSSDIGKWSYAFKKITIFSGVEYGKKSTNDASFIEEVVDNVRMHLPPNNQRDDTHIMGKERLVKEVECMFNEIPDIKCGVKVLGLHGMSGIGKTTLCHALCNFYLFEFGGRVCHVQLHEGSQRDRINSVLSQLGPRNDSYSRMSDIEAQKNLQTTLLASKFFLIIDDIRDSDRSDKDEIGHLLLYRLKDIPMGSKLLCLAQHSCVLRNVLSTLPEWSDSHIRPFPGLILDEAKLILCREFPPLFPDTGSNDPQQIKFLNQCVGLCMPEVGKYNPLMLKLLCSFLVERWSIATKAQRGCREGKPHLKELEQQLVALKRDRSRGMKEFFDRLQTGFNSLTKEYQELFLDLALFLPREDVVLKQRCLRRDKEVVMKILEKLRDASFLLDDYGMLDVYKELAKRIARESSAIFYAERRKWKGADLRHIVKDTWTRVAFVDCTFCNEKARLDLSKCDNIQILLLAGNTGINAIILDKNSLQSVEIRSHSGIAKQQIDSCFLNLRCLAILELGGIETSFWDFDAAKLNHCDSLEMVHLYNMNLEMGTWELPNWPHLKELRLSQVSNLETLSGLECVITLKKLCLSRLKALKCVLNVQHLCKLAFFLLSECNEVAELSLPGSLQHCTIEKCGALSRVHLGSNLQGTSDVNPNGAGDATETDSSDGEQMASSENRILIKDCGSLEEMSGLVDLKLVHSSVYSAVERGQPPTLKGFHSRRHANACLEFHKVSGSSWHLHGLALVGVERNGFVQELLGNAAGLKNLSIVCGDTGNCGCGADPPSFHLLPCLESLEYHCSHVVDLSPIKQCPRLRILRLDGCTSVPTQSHYNFCELLSLTVYCAPKAYPPIG